MAFSPDGSLLAMRRPHSVHLVDSVTGNRLARMESPTPHLSGYLCFSPDGGLLAVRFEPGPASCSRLACKRWNLTGICLPNLK